MKFVAFFRNVNLGQRNSPTRSQLESAFLQAGASEAASVLSNGTLVFSVSDGDIAQVTSVRACATLRQTCGLNEPAFVRSLSHLAALAAEDPFADFGDLAVYERCISIFDRQAMPQVAPPLESQRKDCIIFRIDDGEALSVTREVNGKAGYPTPVLERALNVPVTTRSWTTLLRVIDIHR
jgi:uncharacterized protein (DUF1697 family)